METIPFRIAKSYPQRDEVEDLAQEKGLTIT
jgi:hypothetical protein